jgi:hypothetical protein
MIIQISFHLNSVVYPIENCISEERSIELQTITGSAHSPVQLANVGPFRSGPIKSLWAESTTTVNGECAKETRIRWHSIFKHEYSLKDLMDFERIDSFQGETAGSFRCRLEGYCLIRRGRKNKIRAWIQTVNIMIYRRNMRI